MMNIRGEIMPKLKVDYVSDLHINHYVKFTNHQQKWERQTRDWTRNLLKDSTGEVLVLAGDFSEWNNQSKWFIEECGKHYDHVFVTIGNHDYYLLSKNQRKKYRTSMNRRDELFEMISDLPNVSTLFGETKTYKGFTFGGHSLWYNPKSPDEINWFETFSNDSRYIFAGQTYNQKNFDVLHQDAMNWYNTLKEYTFDVFVSHVPPVHPPRNRNLNSGDASYVADVPFLVNTRHWICGHQHVQTSFEKFGVKFYMNPIGYPDEENYVNVRTFTVEK